MRTQAFTVDSDGIIINKIIVDDSADIPISCILFNTVSGDPVKGKYYDTDQNSVYHPNPPFAGWTLNNTTWEYDPPTADPSTSLKYYNWNVDEGDWALIEQRDSEQGRWSPV